MSASVKLRFIDEDGVTERSKHSIRVPPTTSTAMAAALPPSTSTAMATALPPSTPTSMAAPPSPYDRVLMDDGSSEPSKSAAASLNMDGRNFYESNQEASWIKSVRLRRLYCLAANFRRLVLAVYDEARVLGISTTTTPTILLLGSESAIAFCIAVDDMDFQALGRFAKSLHSYMEMVSVSNVKYDPKESATERVSSLDASNDV
uniref:Uncharacterized protein n=1 Tax=Panagrolaimus davidi TaxID=227884 RepID=A0A914R0B6_9BILA